MSQDTPGPDAPPDELLAAAESAERDGDFTGATLAYQSLARRTDPAVRGDALFRLGRVAWRLARYDEAMARYDAAREVAMRAGLTALRARIENGLGAVHYSRGELAQARACYHAALELAEEPGQQGKILLNLGVIANVQGDLPAARALYLRGREAFARGGDAASEALVLHNLGMLQSDLGEWEEATASFEACIALCERTGDRQMIANVLVNLAEVLGGRDRERDALSLCDRALAIYGEIGDEVGRAEALRRKGILHRAIGSFDLAEKALREAHRMAQRMRSPLIEAEAALEMGLVQEARHDAAGAARWLARAAEGFATLGAAREEEAARAALARVAGAAQESATKG